LSGCGCLPGRDVIVAIALANEISSRVGSVAPGQFDRSGFHPTGLFAPFGITYLAGKLFGSSAVTLAHAAGICGSVAAGLLECWVDGTQSKFLHSGFAAQSGIASATLAHAGVTGPPTVLEGRFGLFASHLQLAEAKKGVRDAWPLSRPNGQALYSARLVATELGDGPGAQRLFDRTIVELERASGSGPTSGAKVAEIRF
jgi:2-methylcitrate dehydratase PrpD